MKKSYWVFVEGTRVMWTSGLAYKNTCSLQHTFNAVDHSLTCWSWWARWWPRQEPLGPSAWCILYPAWPQAGIAGSGSSFPEHQPAPEACLDTHPSPSSCLGWLGFGSGRKSGGGGGREYFAWYLSAREKTIECLTALTDWLPFSRKTNFKED